MFFVFQSGNEFIKLKINRKDNRLEIATSKTNYRYLPQPYYKLFGTVQKTMTGVKPPTQEDSIKEMKEAEKLTDGEFREKLITDGLNLGYVLVKCQY